MRGMPERQQTLFHTLSWADMIPLDHPLRRIKREADNRLKCMGQLFDDAYSDVGRPSIPPEQLIKGTLLMALFSIRSERQLCEQIQYNLLYKWFLDMQPDEVAWHPTTFTKNRERLLAHGLMEAFFKGTVREAVERGIASTDHFSVDGALIEAWAGMKSFRPKDEDDDDPSSDSNGWVDWKGENRSNETHESKTDPEARLARKGDGQGAILAHSLHAMIENRSGIIVDVVVDRADGYAERIAAVAMLDGTQDSLGITPETLGADKGYDDGEFLGELERRSVTPHVPVRKGKINPSNPTGEYRKRARQRARNKGYKLSQRHRMKIEGIFGWLKNIAGLRKTRFVGQWKTNLYAMASASAYNILRLAKLAKPEVVQA